LKNNLKNINHLKEHFKQLDGKGYKSYKEIKGAYQADFYELHIDHVQGDPYAVPSKVSIRVSLKTANFPSETYSLKIRKIALCDFVNRIFYKESMKYSRNSFSADKSGLISIYKPEQQILERSAIVMNEEYIEARILMGLPARGRRIDGKLAIDMFFNSLPKIVEQSMLYASLDKSALKSSLDVNQDADFLRSELGEHNLIAFIANCSHLPRESGISDKPMQGSEVIEFKSPGSMEVSFDLPNYGVISGMGIKKGVTLIVGGGYHGKSTLLKALEKGVYNHVTGDGREYVVTDFDAVKIRAEDGRCVNKTTISPFIKNIPYGKSTDAFSTENASGSTSQAANIIEAIEVGARVLLIDEDTSATNFMIRDHRMQELVAKIDEPITPFVDKAKQLFDEKGISTILVMGGSGDYFDIADDVVKMHDYLPENVTSEAKDIAQKIVTQRIVEGGESFGKINQREVLLNKFNSRKGKNPNYAASKGINKILIGNSEINLNYIEQLVEVGQVTAIADAIVYLKNNSEESITIYKLTERLVEKIKHEGLDFINQYQKSGDYAVFRKYEIAAAINRIRGLDIVIKNKI
jgi:predicted ABC-class ATPase